MIKWGIIGCGGIANKFAEDILNVKDEDAKIVAVSSKSEKRARDFAAKHDIKLFYDSYEKMLQNEDVDAVYVATTHNFHYENTMLCLKFNKHVLCEKSFAINAKQAKEVFDFAKSKNLFVMEGMWSRFLPATRWAKKQVLDGQIGDIVSVVAQFGGNIGFDPKSRLYDINLAGGGLLDLGIYPISFVCNFLGNKPTIIAGVAKFGDTNVDEQASISLLYEGGQTGNVTYTMRTNYESQATVYGTKGRVVVDHTCFSKKATLYKDDGIKIEFVNDGTNGFEHEITAAVNNIVSGKLQSDVISGTDTVEILEICDELRKQWDFWYPEER